MIYELRIYEVEEGRMQELVDRFRLHTLRLFKKHGITPVVFLGVDESSPNRFSYVVSFPDKKTQTESWNSFLQDQERIDIWDKSNQNGKLVSNIETVTYKAIDS